MQPTTIETTSEEHAAVFHIQGVLDHESSTSLETSIENTLSSGKKRIILNCEKLSFISSKGIGALLYMSKITRQRGGVLVLCSLNDECAALFSLLKLGRYIQTVPDYTQALRAQYGTEEDNGERLSIEAADKEDILIRTGNSAEKIRIFNSPIIAECAECATLIRIPKEGDYICPSCKTEFQVKANGTVIF